MSWFFGVRYFTVFIGLLAGMLFGAPARASEPPLDQEAIAYRKHMMNTLDAQFQAIMLIITRKVPADNITSHLDAALITARTGLPSFAKNAPGGTSQPYLWDQWDQYTMLMQEFEAATAMAVEAAKTSTLTELIWYLDQISCRKCHDVYRLPPIGSRGELFLGR